MHIKFLNNLTAKNKKDKMQNYLHPIFFTNNIPRADFRFLWFIQKEFTL